MQSAGLHWFRHQQRSLSRIVLAAFCLTWLQFAATPCVMALDSESGMAARSSVADAAVAAPMPAGMAMAPGEHCQYCPPAQAPDGVDPAVCSYPHDPQVDSRVGFAVALMAPPPTLVLMVAADEARTTTVPVVERVPAPLASTSLAVSLCRFLK